MKVTWEYTFPFPYPVRRFPLPIEGLWPPVMGCSASAGLVQGAKEILGVGITTSHMPTRSTIPGLVSFFEIDLNEERVVHCSTTIADKFLSDVEFSYDQQRTSWLCGVKYFGETGDEFSFYDVAPTGTPQWIRRAVVKGDEHIGTGYKGLVSFWSADQTVTCVFVVPDIGEIDDAWLYWTTWHEVDGESRQDLNSLGDCEHVEARVSKQACLLVVVERVLDEYLSPQRDRTGPGRWVLSYRVYSRDGRHLHQEVIPQLTTPIRNTRLPDHDFWESFDLRFVIENGPPAEKERQPTWVVSVALREPKPSYQRRAVEKAGIADKVVKQAIGRLLWIDEQGRLLQSVEGIVGKEVTMCTCGKEVIGTELRDGQWRLWHWVPSEEAGVRLGTPLPVGVERATVVAEKDQGQGERAFFWCIEEYANGVRVTQRSCKNDEERSTVWLEGFLLCHNGSGARLYLKCAGIALSQGRLVLLGIGQDETFKLLCFQ